MSDLELLRWDGDPSSLPTLEDAGRTSKKTARVIESLRSATRMARALRWSGDYSARERDVKTPRAWGEVAFGYDFNSYTNKVSKAWTKSNTHGSGWDASTGGSQRSRSLYSTRLRALRALRLEVEVICARRLAAIDAAIESEVEFEELAADVIDERPPEPE